MEYSNNRGSFEYIDIPECIEVKMENSDMEAGIPGESDIEKIVKTEGKIIIKEEGDVILRENIVEGVVNW